MKLIIVIFALILMTLPFGLAGCSGGGADIQQTTTTLGQELQDLDSAHKQGLLSDKEYSNARKDLIKKHTD